MSVAECLYTECHYAECHGAIKLKDPVFGEKKIIDLPSFTWAFADIAVQPQTRLKMFRFKLKIKLICLIFILIGTSVVTGENLKSGELKNIIYFLQRNDINWKKMHGIKKE